MTNKKKDLKRYEVKERAWKEMAQELVLKNDKVLEQLWNNLKK